MEVIVYTFSIGDVDDLDLYCSQILTDWQKSELGKWVMANAKESPMWVMANAKESPMWTREVAGYHWVYHIIADLSDEDYTFFNLKWKNYDEE